MLVRSFLSFLYLSLVSAELENELGKRVPDVVEKKVPHVIQPISYDLQLQFPLSEVTDPETPLFTGRAVIQFQLGHDVGAGAPFLSDSSQQGATIKWSIDNLDHFENVSLVFNGAEVPIANVLLTDSSFEIRVEQPILFSGRYTLTIDRYKGFIGNALYYRDAGEHAVFGSALFPKRAAAVFPTVLPATQKVTMLVGIVHPKGIRALSTAAQEGKTKDVDQNWQMTSFRATAPMPPSLLALSLLPAEYSIVKNTYTGIDLSVHYNRFRLQEAQAKHLLSTATQVLGLLKLLFTSSLVLPKLDLIFMNDVVYSPSLGTIIIPEGSFLSSDFATQTQLLSEWIARHWIGALVAVDDERDICIQEDLLAFIGLKVARRTTNDDYLRLAHYAKVILTETVFEPGLSLTLKQGVDENDISSRCGLRGVIMLESLENLLGEKRMLQVINNLVFNSKREYFDTKSFMSLVNETVDDNVSLAQVFLFWRQHGGVPHLDVDRLGDTIRLRQRGDNRTVQNGGEMWEKMPLWPLPLSFNEFRLPVQMMLSLSVHLNPVRETLTLANLGFTHMYRVNYDVDTWRGVMESLTQNSSLFTSRERIQLTSDFCQFYSLGVLAEPAGTRLRDDWLGMLRRRDNSFPLCELAAYQCVASRNLPIRSLTLQRARVLRKRLWAALSNSSEMRCGRGAVHDVVNELCTDLYERSCF